MSAWDKRKMSPWDRGPWFVARGPAGWSAGRISLFAGACDFVELAIVALLQHGLEAGLFKLLAR